MEDPYEIRSNEIPNILIKFLKTFQRIKDAHMSVRYSKDPNSSYNLHAPDTTLLSHEMSLILAGIINNTGFTPIVLQIIQTMITNYYHANLKVLIPLFNSSAIYRQDQDIQKALSAIENTYANILDKI